MKPCIHCGKPFTPAFSSTQVACSVRCAAAYTKKQRQDRDRAEKAETKRRKAAIKRLPDLKAEAQKAVNAWIRARDARQPCISCGAPPPDMSELHAGRDAGHYRSVGSAQHLRYHEDNIHAQCVKCNQWGAGKAVDYRIGLIARIGLARVEALETDNTVKKWTREELIAIRDLYRAKTKELRKETA